MAYGLATLALASATLFHISNENHQMYSATQIRHIPVTRGIVINHGKELLFKTPFIMLTVHTGPAKDMFSYRIQGLRNPTIVVPKGATIDLTFVNNDPAMSHDIRFGITPNYKGSSLKRNLGVGSPILSHEKNGVYSIERILMHSPASDGTFAYFCTVQNDAAKGMHGKFIVK